MKHEGESAGLSRGPPGSVAAGVFRERALRLSNIHGDSSPAPSTAVRVTLRPVEHSVSPCCSISQLSDSFSMMEREMLFKLYACLFLRLKNKEQPLCDDNEFKLEVS